MTIYFCLESSLASIVTLSFRAVSCAEERVGFLRPTVDGRPYNGGTGISATGKEAREAVEALVPIGTVEKMLSRRYGIGQGPCMAGSVEINPIRSASGNLFTLEFTPVQKMQFS
jgi:hypothetical protein